MRAKIFFLCSLAAALPNLKAQPDPGELLQRVTQKVLDTVARLPKYLCTQTVDRSQFNPPTLAAARKCEAGERKDLSRNNADRLRLDVAIVAGREMYSWVGESQFQDGSLFELVHNGALSTGSFSTYLTMVFRDDDVSFAYKGETSESGRHLFEFDFRVPVGSSHYLFGGGGKHVTAGYSGSILVDPVTADLVRMTVQTETLPAETRACESSTTLNYSRARLNGADFLLPTRVQLHILDDNGVDLENSTVFSNCHEYLGESTIHFDDGPEPGVNSASKPEDRGPLPAGLSFTIALSEDIDQNTLAAGDKITAKLIGAINGPRHNLLVPKGALITARVMQVRRYYAPQSYLRLVLKLETLEAGGVTRPLIAHPDTRLDSRLPSVRHSVGYGMDNQDAQSAVIIFYDARGRNVPSRGLEFQWLTAAK